MPNYVDNMAILSYRTAPYFQVGDEKNLKTAVPAYLRQNLVFHRAFNQETSKCGEEESLQKKVKRSLKIK